jgi:hypothetical protein
MPAFYAGVISAWICFRLGAPVTLPKDLKASLEAHSKSLGKEFQIA